MSRSEEQGIDLASRGLHTLAKVKPKWTRYELDLSKYDLGRACNGFTFVLARNQQEDSHAPVHFFLDNIYFQ